MRNNKRIIQKPNWSNGWKDWKELEENGKELTILDVIVQAFEISRSEGKRLIKQGGVKVITYA